MEKVLCRSVYLGGLTIRMERFLSSLMSCKFSGMNQGW